MGESSCSSHTEDVHFLVQVLNGAIAAALFNLLYDVVLSQKVKWYALCCVLDFINHSSRVQARLSRSLGCSLDCLSRVSAAAIN